MVCKHCGTKTNSPSSATGTCSSSPTKHHVWVNEHEGNYTCEYCGTHTTSPSSATGTCSNSPTKRHVWI